MQRAIEITIGMELFDDNTGTTYKVLRRNAGDLAIVETFDEDEDGNPIKSGEGYLTPGEIAKLAGAQAAYWPNEEEK